MEARVPPTAGRVLTVDLLPSTWSFQAWLADLEVSLSGIAISAAQRSVNHAFRIIRRGDLRFYEGHEKWQVDQERVSKISVKTKIESAKKNRSLVWKNKSLVFGCFILFLVRTSQKISVLMMMLFA